MVGLHAVGHLVRRAVAASPDQFHIEQLKKAASLYEDSPDAQIKPAELLPMLITGLVFVVLFISVI